MKKCLALTGIALMLLAGVNYTEAARTLKKREFPFFSRSFPGRRNWTSIFGWFRNFVIFSCWPIVMSHRSVLSTISEKISPECGSSDSFACNDERCIPMSWRCDGDIDCADEEDERNCPSEIDRNRTLISCIIFRSLWIRRTQVRWGEERPLIAGTIQVYPEQMGLWRRVWLRRQIRWVQVQGWVFWKKIHVRFFVSDVSCQENQFQCEELSGDYSLCIPETWVCDGQRDCTNGKDEQNCTTKVTKCPDNNFQYVNCWPI